MYSSFNDLKFLSNIKIKRYLIDLILPKCNLVFGNKFSSVYLQLLINRNNNCNSPKWKIGKSWISLEKISQKINCNIRTTMKMIEAIQRIGLIEKSYHGKLYMFSFYHNDLHSLLEIKKLNYDIEMKLLSLASDDKIVKLKNQFQAINANFKVDNDSYYNFNDSNSLRENLARFEKLKSGVSLLFLKFFGNYFVNSMNSDKLFSMSHREIASKIGCSQSTVSRMLTIFQESGCVNMIAESSKSPSTIILNNQTENVQPEKIKCPICNKEVDNIKKLKAHVSRCKDDVHKLFKEILIEAVITQDQINKVYVENLSRIDKIRNEKMKSVEQESKVSYDLLRYFYGLTGTKCPSWPKEVAVIKSHLKTDMRADEIMEVFRYMAKRGYPDLRFFNNCINDALILSKCRQDINKEGSEAYLIKLYYKGMNQKMTDRTVLLGYKKIKELQNSNYDYAQIKTIIEYMINVKCPNFNFIVTMANEALTNSKDKNQMAKTYKIEELISLTLNGVIEYGMIMLEGGTFDILDKKIILKLKEDLCNGNVELTRVNVKYRKFAVRLAREIHKNRLYNKDIPADRWLKLVQLDLINS